MGFPAQDLTGQRFGNWTVLRRATPEDLEDRKAKCVVYFVCRCVCGRQSLVQSAALRYSGSSMCMRCAAFERKAKDFDDLLATIIGKRFGELTVEAYAGKDEGRGHLWTCRCDCGRCVVRSTGNLNGRGARRGVRCKPCADSRRRVRSTARIWSGILSRCKQIGREVDVTREEAMRLLEDQDYKCALTGLSIGFRLGTRKNREGETTASIDRIDSTKGYISGNIHWVHKDVNMMKQSFDMDRFVELCRLVVAKADGRR